MPAATAEPSHACIRCQAPVPLTVSMCRSCNPAGLAQPAASQAHGTVFAGIAIAVAAMLAAAVLLVGGVGPFRARVTGAVASGNGLTLTISIANEGGREGSATCRVWDASWLGNPPRETYIKSPPVPAGATITFQQTVGALGTRAGALAADCSR